MVKEQILALAALISTTILSASSSATPLLSPIPDYLLVINQKEKILAEHSLDLTIREVSPEANQGFVDNILLALHYLQRGVKLPVDWEAIRQPFTVSFTLQPKEIFAFHGNVLSDFADPAVTMNSGFFTYEGYKSVWGLGGNGVCHLASLMNWTASEAGMEVVAPNGHNFAPIPGVSKEYGTSIRSQSQNQNLYIINNLENSVSFVFTANGKEVSLQIIE
ncbi:hypothetical protein AMJ51_01595 [Microgenomates bacterium DG_75]|nr:MAG: hypothetical protein AMJ51_01595 [Microgenomates bacterium DG_75]